MFFLSIPPLSIYVLSPGMQLITAWVVCHVHDPAGEIVADEYLVYSESETDDSETKLGHSVINSLAIVAVFFPVTFLIVFCYWANCMTLLLGYMLFSSGLLLAMLGCGIEIYVPAWLIAPGGWVPANGLLYLVITVRELRNHVARAQRSS